MPSPSNATVARVELSQHEARRAADVLGELLDPYEAAISIFEASPQAWALEVCFDEDADAMRARIASVLGESAAGLTITSLNDRDWVAESLAGLNPVRAGRFIVHGQHDRRRVPANAIGIEIEAALAFGTGHHGTTRGCLLAFDDWRKRTRPGARRKVLDVGTGTGVLAIAAAKGLRQRVIAGDIDPKSVQIARGNAEVNHVGALVTAIEASGLSNMRIARGGPYDLVFANILLKPLQRLAVPIARAAARRATIILSGLLPQHANAAIASYRAAGFHLTRRHTVDGWITLVIRPAGKARRHS